MFTVQERDSLREYVLALAAANARVVAGAVIGSVAVGRGDEFSDLDLSFGINDDASVGEVLDSWTSKLASEREAVPLADVERKASSTAFSCCPTAFSSTCHWRRHLASDRAGPTG